MTARKLLFDGSVGLLYLFILAPLVCVVAVSFNGDALVSFPPTSLSFKWYIHALSLDLFIQSAKVSFYLAVAATVIGVSLGTLAAIGLSRSKSRFKPLIESIFLAPLVVPGLVIGLSLLIALSAAQLYSAPIRLLIGHILVVTPYSIRTVLASLSKVDETLEEAALTLGATPVKTFFLVTLPLIRPGLIAGAIFSFILSFDDVTVSLFLIDARTGTLPIAIMSYLEYSFDPSVAAISSLMIIVTLVLALSLERLFGLKRLLGA
jgi:putative spermidine/putrescine transport system permease protein